MRQSAGNCFRMSRIFNWPFQEEDVTDDNGAFRVRGLQPKCTYHLTLTDQTGAKLESYPPFFSFEVSALRSAF